ncbi:hypothetical protein [Bacteroides sp.]|uniref:hypothetical protein n=1 Tax=Bacteroides sp. TaxID=29523 RepID=UPI00262E1707|nr:hypothetical protein [Bacteroides sp.]MDD3040490.1 hypothetical protein [Bacteroides sp.]
MNKFFEKINYGELLVVFLLMECFFGLASVSDVSQTKNLQWEIIGNTVQIFACVISAVLYIKINRPKYKIKVKNIIKENACFVVVIAFLIALRVLQLNILPRWDTETYANTIIVACEKFDLSITSFIENFRLASHISHAYGALLAMGYYAIPNSVVGIRIVNIILTIFAIIFLYRYFVEQYPMRKRSTIALTISLFFVAPLNLGLFESIGLDYALLVFLIYIFYFQHTKKYILTTFFSCCLIFSKETGAILFCGYWLGYICSILMNQKGKLKDKFHQIVKSPLIWGAFISGCVFMFYQIYIRFFSQVKQWGESIQDNNSGSPNNVFGFDVSYILLKFKTFFVLNFNWVLSIIIIVALIFLIKKGRVRQTIKSNTDKLPLLFSVFFFCGFSCLYITYNNSRYNFCVEFLLFFVVIHILLRSNLTTLKIRMGTICLSAIMLLQTYFTVDPISKMMFKTINSGSVVSMLSTAWHKRPSLEADVTCYNYQHTFLDKAYDKALNGAGYDGTQDIILWGNFDPGVGAVALEGRWMQCYWDKENRKRVYFGNSNSLSSINVIYEDDFWERLNEQSLNKSAIFIFSPYFLDNEEESLSTLGMYYDIGEQKEAYVKWQGAVYSYKMTLKENEEIYYE